MSKARGLADLGNAFDDGALSNRNLIINGAMQVAQRGTSKTGVTVSGYYTCDRWSDGGDLATRTVTQEADGPSGFANSYKIEITTANLSPGAPQVLVLLTKFEGQDLQRIKKGTADAQPITLSFWVKSNKTGTYIVEFDDNDNSRNINKSYTVDVSGAWEYKTITFDADVIGSFDNDANESADILFWLDSGSNYRSGTLATSWESTTDANRNVGGNTLGDTIGNYFQITGVQLEVGDTATPFEHRSYGDELARCQRYYWRSGGGSNNYYYTYSIDGGTTNRGAYQTKVKMRAAPSLSYDINTGTILAAYVDPDGETFRFSSTGSAIATDVKLDAEL